MKYIPLVSILAFSLMACQESSNSEENTEHITIEQEEDSIPAQSLKAQLDERKQNFERKADKKVKAIYKDGIDAVAKSGILENALQNGQKAPNFKLKNALGDTVELADYLAKGPVILTWYRGGWCPYCNLTLHKLQKELPKFKAQGANLIALTPELPDSSITTAEKNDLNFEVLSDLGNAVARKYGVVFKLTPEVAEIYNKKFDLEAYNGDSSNELPLAATYIINKDGTIVYAFLDADYRNRAEPSELTAILKNLEWDSTSNALEPKDETCSSKKYCDIQ